MMLFSRLKALTTPSLKILDKNKETKIAPPSQGKLKIQLSKGGGAIH